MMDPFLVWAKWVSRCQIQTFGWTVPIFQFHTEFCSCQAGKVDKGSNLMEKKTVLGKTHYNTQYFSMTFEWTDMNLWRDFSVWTKYWQCAASLQKKKKKKYWCLYSKSHIFPILVWFIFPDTDSDRSPSASCISIKYLMWTQLLLMPSFAANRSEQPWKEELCREKDIFRTEGKHDGSETDR